MTDPSTPHDPPSSDEPPLPAYKGAELDPARGPGLGCFYVQLVALVALLVLTPLSVQWDWPFLVSAFLLLLIIVLLLLSGQTIIFLLRLVAAERGRRRPLAGRSRTIGELEDQPPGKGTPGASAEDGGSVRE